MKKSSLNIINIKKIKLGSVALSGCNLFATALFTTAVLTSCSLQRYQAKPISAQAATARYLAHDPNSSEFQQYLLAFGYSQASLPLQTWGLRELTLSALFFHPQLNVARAQWRAAMSAEITAAQRPLPGLSSDLENHSQKDGGVSPWTYGLSIDLPVETAGKRQARIDRAVSLSTAARIDIAQNAWQVRSRLLVSLIEYLYISQLADSVSREVTVRQEIVAMLEKRLAAGMASTLEMSNARLQLQKAQQTLLAEQGRLPALRAALASNSGLSLNSFDQLSLADPSLLSLADMPIVLLGNISQTHINNAMQQAALLNRLDIRAALSRYQAAEARLKLEIARQYPDVVLSPGYSYDQDDRIWSLGFSTLLTFVHGNRGLIAEATALREVEAAQFEALQASIISELTQARQRYWSSQNELQQARQLQQGMQQRTLQSERQFDAGLTDRLEFATTRLENIVAEQSVLTVAYKVELASSKLEDILQLPLQQITSMPTNLDEAVLP